MSDTYEPSFFRGPRMAVYLALIAAGFCLVTGPRLDDANTQLRIAEAQHLGIPIERVDGRTVVFLHADPSD